MAEFVECGDSSPLSEPCGDESPHSTWGGLNDDQGHYKSHSTVPWLTTVGGKLVPTLTWAGSSTRLTLLETFPPLK